MQGRSWLLPPRAALQNTEDTESVSVSLPDQGPPVYFSCLLPLRLLEEGRSRERDHEFSKWPRPHALAWPNQWFNYRACHPESTSDIRPTKQTNRTRIRHSGLSSKESPPFFHLMTWDSVCSRQEQSFYKLNNFLTIQ